MVLDVARAGTQRRFENRRYGGRYCISITQIDSMQRRLRLSGGRHVTCGGGSDARLRRSSVDPTASPPPRQAFAAPPGRGSASSRPPRSQYSDEAKFHYFSTCTNNYPANRCVSTPYMTYSAYSPLAHPRSGPTPAACSRTSAVRSQSSCQEMQPARAAHAHKLQQELGSGQASGRWPATCPWASNSASRGCTPQSSFACTRRR